MSRKIIWSNYLKEEAIYRFWYTLENNNFKNAIKKAQKQGKMNYAIMHNALYSGLYFPENDYVYPYRAIKDIRRIKQLGNNATLANFMSRNEILMNIHAMNESAKAIRHFAQYGYNAKLFAKEFHEIGKTENNLLKEHKVRSYLLYNTLPSKNELKPNTPNRYNLSKNFIKKQQNKPAVFKKDTSLERESRFNKALNKYRVAKSTFDFEIFKLHLKDRSKTKLFYQFLDAGVYRSSIPHLGFDFDNLVSQVKNPRQIVTLQELLLHAKKYENGAKALSEIKSVNAFSQFENPLFEAGLKSRFDFIKKHRTFPETKIGFLNTFCEMISENLELDPLLKEKITDKNTPEMATTLIDVISKLKNQYLTTKDKDEKREIDLQMKKIEKALGDSNEHNI